MNKRKPYTNRRKKIIRYLGITLIIIGLLIIIWPFYTNFVLTRRESIILTAWGEELEKPQETGAEEEENETELQLEKETELIDSEKKLPFRIYIPEINTDWVVNEGTDYLTLKEGPGFFSGSALPGEIGTCVIAGHRTTYGAPFNRLDELEEGDEIFLETIGNERFTYIVTGEESVHPQDVSVLKNTEYPSLVLSTCTPKYFSTRRLIIFARIIE